MLWDQTGRSWQQLDIPIQPAAVLLGRDGHIVATWHGVVQTDKVLRALPNA